MDKLRLPFMPRRVNIDPQKIDEIESQVKANTKMIDYLRARQHLLELKVGIRAEPDD